MVVDVKMQRGDLGSSVIVPWNGVATFAKVNEGTLQANDYLESVSVLEQILFTLRITSVHFRTKYVLP